MLHPERKTEMRKIPLFVAIALTLSVPLLAIRADEVPEETPGTSEYFTKYVEGRFAFTNLKFPPSKGQRATSKPL